MTKEYWVLEVDTAVVKRIRSYGNMNDAVKHIRSVIKNGSSTTLYIQEVWAISKEN